MSNTKKFFGRIWEWFKEAAWFQVLLMVGVVIGIVLSITPITQAISGWIEDSKKIKYFENHRINYTDFIAKIERLNEDNPSEKEFGVIFYKYSSANDDLEKGLNNYISNYDSPKTIYALDINCNSAWGDAHADDSNYYDTYKISKSQLLGIRDAIVPAFENNVEDINDNKQEVEQTSTTYSTSDESPISENTIVWFSAEGTSYSSVKYTSFTSTQGVNLDYRINKVYTTIQYNRSDADTNASNNYMIGVARFFNQTDLKK